jgi:chlorophyll synthase
MGDAMPAKQSILLALLYSLGDHGIMTLNDFKAIEGDRKMGVRSLPVQLGVRGAAINACSLMLFPQACVTLILLAWNMPWRALTIAMLMLGQLVMMLYFLRDPIKRALFLSGFGVPLFVAGMMVSAFAVSNLH